MYLHFLMSLSAFANSAYFKNVSELYCKEVSSLLVIISLYIAPTEEATTVHGKQIWRKIEQAYWSKLKYFRTDKSLFELNPSPNSLFFNYDTQVMIQVKLHELKNSSEQALVNYLIIWFHWSRSQTRRMNKKKSICSREVHFCSNYLSRNWS